MSLSANEKTSDALQCLEPIQGCLLDINAVFSALMGRESEVIKHKTSTPDFVFVILRKRIISRLETSSPGYLREFLDAGWLVTNESHALLKIDAWEMF